VKYVFFKKKWNTFLSLLPDFRKSFDSRNVPMISPFIDKDIPELFLKSKFVGHSKNSVAVITTNQLILYAEIIAVFYVIHTKPTNVFCKYNVKIFNVKLCPT